MIKRLYILIGLLFSICTVSGQNQAYNIYLTEGIHDKDTIKIEGPFDQPFFNIYTEIIDSEPDVDAKVDIYIENLYCDAGLSIFHKEYSEKQLKKLRPKIKYDKTFSGTKGERTTVAFNNTNEKSIERSIHLFPYGMYPTSRFPDYRFSTGRKKIVSLYIKDGDTTTVKLPIYIVKYTKRRMILQEINSRVLNITVDLQPSQRFLSIKDRCDQLVEEYNKSQFCDNPQHEPSLEKQKEELQNKIDSCINDIKSITYVAPKVSKRYAEQEARLKALDLSKKEGDCGQHRKTRVSKPYNTHQCNYCHYSPQQVYRELEDIYQILYSAPNKKGEFINKANSIYNCPKAKNKWKNSKYNNQIKEYYNAIIHVK